MRAWRSLVAYRVVCFEKEVVIAPSVNANLRIVVHRTQSEWSPTSPAAHHLRRQEFLSLRIGSIVLQVLTKLGDTLMQLAKDDIASIASQNLRLRNLRRITDLIGISEHELARF